VGYLLEPNRALRSKARNDISFDNFQNFVITVSQDCVSSFCHKIVFQDLVFYQFYFSLISLISDISTTKINRKSGVLLFPLLKIRRFRTSSYFDI
jgi:hypothetical protein